jgi:hypothetical protein
MVFSGNFSHLVSTHIAGSLLPLSDRLSTMCQQRANGVFPDLQNCFEQSYPQALDLALRAKHNVNIYSNQLIN